MRLIDADALKKEVENLVVGGADGLKNYYENGSKSDENAWIGGIYDAWELIDNAPTVMERPQGEWIEVTRRISDSETTKHWECSICKEPDRKDGKSKFCSNCGAQMQKGGAE